MSDERDALLLYDGTCGFCASSVQFILHHEARSTRTLRFASLQSGVAARIRAAHPEIDAIDSVIWFQPGRNGESDVVFVRSRAVLHVLDYLGGPWSSIAGVASIVPRVVRDALYDFIARHRRRIIARDPSCLVPTPDQRVRFLDLP